MTAASAPFHRSAARAAALLGVLLACASLRPAPAAADAGAAALVEKEFAAAIKRLTPATVVVVGKGAPKDFPGSSGVIVTKSGYVLSDGDAPLVAFDAKGGKRHGPEVEVRVLDLKRGTYTPYPGRVVKRINDLDSCLVKVNVPPSGGFPFVVPGTANELHVGSFTFAMGNSFGFSKEGTPTLTAGVVASLVSAPEGSAWRNAEIYSSAAVNPGVNGGPLVDAEGALVGIVSTWITPTGPEAKSPYQFLSKVMAIDPVREAYRDVPEWASIFPDPKTLPPKSKSTDLLERAIGGAAKRAGACVASLDVTPSGRFVVLVPGRDGQGRPINAPFPRYEGPISGLVVSSDGWIVTSLYNLANVLGLLQGGVNDIDDALKKITAITAHFPSGQSVAARLVAHDQRTGIALIKAAVEGYAVAAAEPAPPESFQVGRLVLCCGNPYGAARRGDPLLTVGMYSRFHPADARDPWRGNFQTDAGVTDTLAGGAMADIHGRILGLATLWAPTQQGRNSGIGFGIPWERIQAVLPSLKEGKSYRYGNGFLGIVWAQDGKDEARIGEVLPGGPAAKAGVLAGDKILAIDGKELKDHAAAVESIRTHFAGDKITVTIERAGKRVYVEVELGDRTKQPQ